MTGTTKNTATRCFCQVAFLLLAAGAASPALAHGNGKAKVAGPISTQEHAFGKEGEPAEATRTITIEMSDKMRFSPSTITVRQGETIRFIVHNRGKMLHEMVIGTLDELKAHGELMKKYPGMVHDSPYMAHVKPGKKENMVWQFSQAGEFHYACLMPGHFEAGMVGKIIVTKG